MKARILFGIAAVLLALLCAGCGAKQAEPAQAAGTDEVQIDSVLPDVSSEEIVSAQTDAPADDVKQEKPADSTAADTAARTTAPAKTPAASSTAKEGASAPAETTTGKAGGASTSVPQLKPPAKDAQTTRSAGEKTSTTKAPAPKTDDKTPSKTPETSGASGSVSPGSVSGKTPAKDPSTPTKTNDSTKPGESTTKRVYEDAKGNAVKAKVTYLNDTPNYVSTLDAEVLERFGIVGDKQKEVLKKPEDWVAYTIELEFVNNETMPVTLYYLDVQDNGQKDVFINGDFSTEMSLLPGKQMSEIFYVLAKRSDSDGAVLNKIHNMKMRVQYAATPADDAVEPTYVYADVG